jgi:hypothetical protein
MPSMLSPLTDDPVNRVEGASKLEVTDADEPSTDGNSQNTPPPDPVAFHTLAKSPKKQQEGELDSPQTAIEQKIKGKHRF